jgi:hypothetical protein
MQTQWSDTLGAINAYVSELPSQTNVYLATFDSGYNGDLSYNVLRNTTAKGYKDVTPTEISPRGGTPLLDSMARLLDTAFEESPDKAYIVVMTDGYENTSKKYNRQVIKEKLARADDRNWEVVFLGANFDQVTDQAQSIGLSVQKSYNISTHNLADEMKFMATQTVAYATAGARTEFTAADRTRATANKK